MTGRPHAARSGRSHAARAGEPPRPTGGRRARDGRGRPGGALSVLAVVAAVCAALYVGDVALPGRPSATGAARPAARLVPLAGTALVCPAAPPKTSGHLSVGWVGGGAGGSAVATQLGVPAGAPTTLLRPPTASGRAPAARHPQLVAATGAAAAGLSGEEVFTGAGIAAAACAPPSGQSSYFVGASGAIGAGDVLELANPDGQPALVDVSAWDGTGPLPVPNGQSRTVPADGVLDLPVAQIAPDAAQVALRVSVQVGRVAAALADGRGGAQFLPGQAAPARRVVLASLPAGRGARWLSVLNPAPADATVTVRVVGAGGDFVPSGLQAVRVPAGRLARVDLTGPLAAGSATLLLSSDQPILATAGALGPGGTHAWVAPAAPLSGRTPAALAGGAVRATLVVTAPGPAARLTLAGAVNAAVDLPAHATREITLASPHATPGEVFVSPGGGTVYACEVLSGPGLALAPLLTPAALVPLRPARPDPAAAYPGTS